MLKNIDDFRFGNRYASRSAAPPELFRQGIEEIRKDRETPGKGGKTERG
jgi:hypothetical protein